MKKCHFYILLVFIFFLYGTSGCSEKAPLKVGYIDSDELMIRWDKYKDSGMQFLKEQEELAKKYSGDPRKMSAQEKMEYLNARETMMTKWNKTKLNLRDEITEAAKEVTKKKKLDMILDNSKSNPTVEYGGNNVTSDILNELDQSKGSKK